MYVCLNCDQTFDDPAYGVVEEYPVPFEDHWEQRRGEVCPYCKSPRISEAFVCQKCGQALPTSERSVLNGDICYDCEEDEEEETEPEVRELDPAFSFLNTFF